MEIKGRAPCLNCEERRIGCHAKDASGAWVCERYGAWCEARETRADEARKKYREAVDVATAHANGVRHAKSRRRRRL